MVFSKHPDNRFRSLFSWSIIVAMALGGSFHALLALAIT